MKKRLNTIEKGRVRWIVFREDNTWYGVALEFNLVVEADDPQTALFELHNTIRGYVQAVRSSKMRPSVLNQTPDSEYSLLWKLLNNRVTRRQEAAISLKQVFSFGTVPQYA